MALGLIALAALVAAAPEAALAGELPPYRDPRLGPRERALDLLSRMTLDEKVGQMTQIYLSFLKQDSDVAAYHLGSFFGGETFPPNVPLAWARQYNRFQKIAVEETRLGIPILWGTDAVHGNSLLLGAVVFPHHIGMGCTWNPSLVERFAQVTAVELRATGRRWAFAPTLDVARHDRWGRTYETFSEDPYLSGVLGVHEVNGYQGMDLAAPHAVLACGKHYLGSGGTVDGIDQGNCVAPLSVVRETHLQPFIHAVKGGLGTVMASLSSVNGAKVTGSRPLLQDLLKTGQGFEGFIVTDWAAIHQVNPDYPAAVEQCINAGIDMSMVPEDYPRFQEVMKDLVASRRILASRVDDAVLRILLAKFRLGLFEDPYVEEEATWVIGSAAHRRAAREAVRESIVLLKNDGLLPLPRNASLLVTGPSADDISRQCGGWTVGWQRAAFPPPGTTILQALREASEAEVTFSADGHGAEGHDAALVVVGEEPYAEYVGDTSQLDLPQDQLALIDRVAATGTPTVVVLVTGRPRTGFESRLAGWNALLVAWLPGTEGGGVADVLFGDFDATGRLAHSWPRSNDQEPINYDRRAGQPYDPLFEFGYGLGYTTFAYRDLQVRPSRDLSVEDQVEVTVRVENTGPREGSEVVLVQGRELDGAGPVAARKLLRFRKLTLSAGRAEAIHFIIPVAELGYFTSLPERTVEPGRFQILAGGLIAELEVARGGTTLAPVERFTPAASPAPPAAAPPVPPGSGSGLVGEYYLSSAAGGFDVLKRRVIDPTVDFDPFEDKLRRETGRGESCAVRWTGWVEARRTESYTFHVRTDDGVRLWVDGKLLVDRWVDRAVGEDYNNLSLTAGRRYPLTLEYYQNGGAAVCQLLWSSLSVPEEAVPRSQLHGEGPPPPWFRRGDSNSDGSIDVSDPLHALRHLFLAGESPRCPDASDANDNGELDISDPLSVLAFLFLGGPVLPAPGPAFCGTDAMEDSLPACVEAEGACE